MIVRVSYITMRNVTVSVSVIVLSYIGVCCVPVRVVIMVVDMGRIAIRVIPMIVRMSIIRVGYVRVSVRVVITMTIGMGIIHVGNVKVGRITMGHSSISVRVSMSVNMGSPFLRRSVNPCPPLENTLYPLGPLPTRNSSMILAEHPPLIPVLVDVVVVIPFRPDRSGP
jgi:hypothetical protein